MKIIVDGIEVDLKVGADPEVFTKSKGKLVSAYGLVPGHKDMPFPVKKGAIQVDGMALEFNIDPAESRDEFIQSVNEVMKQLTDELPRGHTLEIVSTANFGKKYIDSQPEQAKELGCSPDFNAYTGGENPRPNASTPFRTAAGHIHVGWGDGMDAMSKEHHQLCCEVTKIMDLFLGVPSVLLDSDTQRRSLYGSAGAYRAKSYGLEYRVLSNFWLKSSKAMGWAYDQTALAIKKYLEGFRVSDNLEIQEAINSSDKTKAIALMKKHNIKLPMGV